MSRSFTIDKIINANGNRIRFDGGRYLSQTPSGAARKAFSQAYRHMKAKGRLSLEIHIRETTNGSARKIFMYKVRRVAQETEREINGEIITYSYVTKVKAI